jgi:magnesium chelatase subunit D
VRRLERLTDLAARETIIQRRLAFDADPAGFAAEWASADRALAGQILLAGSRLGQVQIPLSIIQNAARLAHSLEVSGHRADIILIKAARAHAAFLEKSEVDLPDLQAASCLALDHRVLSSPLDSPDTLQLKIQRAFHGITGDPNPRENNPTAGFEDALPSGEDDLEQMAEQMQVPGVCAAGSVLLSYLKKKTALSCSTPTRT